MGARKGHAGAPNHAFEALLDYLKRHRGFDFTGYKRSTLVRRVAKRMFEVGVEDYVSYQDYLEVHPDEFGFLFNVILINVTAFFRDASAWEFLAGELLPQIVEEKKPNEPLRVWSAGCASGEEAYTLAMLLAEVLGESAYRRRVKLYATDVDEEALGLARRAVYSAKEVEAVPEALREKYFDHQGDRYAFRTELRRSVIFGRNDLVQDAPISRIDLLGCRNVLMYLNAETQARVLARLHFGLNPGGYLLLGKAEMLLSHSDLFLPVDLKQRFFRKVPRVGVRQQLAVLAEAGNATAQAQLAVQDHVLDSALDAGPVAQIVVDSTGILALANLEAQRLFGVSQADVGRLLQDLEISYRPLELRSLIERVYQEGRVVQMGNVERTLGSGELQYLEVQLAPLRDPQGNALGVSVSFHDQSERVKLRMDLERVRQELEHSNEELQSTNEELETTNEELQSTNEELETTNEELQSGNEELETMNEELQSTNEELRAINEQLQLRTQQLNETNAFLSAVMRGIRPAVVVVDRELQVRAWDDKMHELWGLRADETQGRSLFNLDFGLPVERLRPAVRACLRGQVELTHVEIDATDRLGRSIHCAVSCSPLLDGGNVDGVILMVEPMSGAPGDNPTRSQARTRRSKQ